MKMLAEHDSFIIAKDAEIASLRVRLEELETYEYELMGQSPSTVGDRLPSSQDHVRSFILGTCRS